MFVVSSCCLSLDYSSSPVWSCVSPRFSARACRCESLHPRDLCPSANVVPCEINPTKWSRRQVEKHILLVDIFYPSVLHRFRMRERLRSKRRVLCNVTILRNLLPRLRRNIHCWVMKTCCFLILRNLLPRLRMINQQLPWQLTTSRRSLRAPRDSLIAPLLINVCNDVMINPL